MGYTKQDLIAYGNEFLSPKWQRRLEFEQYVGNFEVELFLTPFDPDVFGIHEKGVGAHTEQVDGAVYDLIDLQAFCEYLDSDDRIKRKYVEAEITAGNDMTLAFDLFDQYMSKVSDSDYENWINECVKCKEFTQADMVKFAEWLYANSRCAEFEYIASNDTSWMEKRGMPITGLFEDNLLKCFGEEYFLPSREVSAWDTVLTINDMAEWAKFLYSRNGQAYRNIVSDAEVEAFLNK